jgi:ACR3 family arsenite transporter
LLGVGRLAVPWQALLLSIGAYVALPLVAGYSSRRWIIAAKGEVISANPLTILWIAVPLFVQTVLIFALGYAHARLLKLSYDNAAPAAMIGASNHFEVAIATAVMLFGLSSGAALATVVGVLIEVPVMLMLVELCKRTAHRFPQTGAVAA